MNAEGISRLSEPQEEMLQYWLQQCGGDGTLPTRSAIKVSDVGKHLSWTVIFEKLSNPLDFRYRLVGTSITERTKADFTGKLISSLDGKGPGSQIWNFLEHIAETKSPDLTTVPYVGPCTRYSHTTLLGLPLAAENNQPPMIVLIADFVIWPGTHTDETIEANNRALRNFITHVKHAYL